MAIVRRQSGQFMPAFVKTRNCKRTSESHRMRDSSEFRKNPVEFGTTRDSMDPYSSLTVEELVRRCAHAGDVAAWEEFVRRFHRLFAKVILRACSTLTDSSKESVDDIIQDTYLKACANGFRLLREFDHRHPNAFVGVLQVVATNLARDPFKERRE